MVYTHITVDLTHRFCGGGKNLSTSAAWTADQWNTLTYTLDHANSTFDVKINGAEALSDINTNTESSTLTGFWLLNSKNNDVYYDDVGLSQSPIPEPASLALVATGSGLVLLRRRRQGVGWGESANPTR